MEANKKRNIPNFLGIGAPKCATTWLSEVLRKHPDVYVAHGKELVYFSSGKKFSLGLDWYLNHFNSAAEQHAIGEFSVSYMRNSIIAAQRIHELNPNMKLIAVLRDPVQRSYSHHRWLKQLGRDVPASFVDAMKKDLGIVSDSLYFRNLEPFWVRFPKENILILKYEELRSNGMKIQREIFRFLGVAEEFDSGLVEKVVGKTIAPRSQRLEKFRIKTHTFVRKNNIAFVITLFKKLGLSNLYRRLNNKNEEQTLTLDEYKAAVPYFKVDVEHLGKYTGIDFSEWLVWKPLMPEHPQPPPS